MLYTDVVNCLNRMDKKIMTLLEKNVGNVREKIKHHQDQLKRNEYFLLVAGKLMAKSVVLIIKTK